MPPLGGIFLQPYQSYQQMNTANPQLLTTNY
jgi:hypothetical protein